MGCIRTAIIIIPPTTIISLCTALMAAFQQHTFRCIRVPWGENQMQPIMAIKDVCFGA